MAGGGVKRGLSYGQTDEFGYNIVDKPVHIRDLNATIFRCLGIDHERLTFKYAGLEQKLTGVEHAKVVKARLIKTDGTEGSSSCATMDGKQQKMYRVTDAGPYQNRDELWGIPFRNDDGSWGRR